MEQSPQNKYLIPLAIVIAGSFVAVAIYFGGGSVGPITRGAPGPDTIIVDIPPVTEKDHIIGSRDADLVIVEYSDTECPYCKDFHNTMKEIVQTYSGKVAWVYRHFPIAQLHARAAKEAEATECAAELGGNQAFWNYIDRVFEMTNSNDSLDPSELPKIAAAVGLDENAFNTCLSSGRYTEFVKKSVEEAVKVGARGTPYSIIVAKNGQKVVINGAEPIAVVKVKIDVLLK
ncbi:MAG: thioredoxin domain-containing protein [Parcubacteria group bacterium]